MPDTDPFSAVTAAFPLLLEALLKAREIAAFGNDHESPVWGTADGLWTAVSGLSNVWQTIMAALDAKEANANA